MTVRAYEPKPIQECHRFPEKKRFDLESEAQEAVSNASNRNGIALFYYPCSSCGGFHLSKRRE